MRKLVLLGIVSLLLLGLERLLASNPRTAYSASTVSYSSYSDWDRFKELFH